MKKLFVGGLPFAYNDDELRNIFQGFELASAIIIKDKFTGRSKGFGFVELADDQMEAAIAKCNGMLSKCSPASGPPFFSTRT